MASKRLIDAVPAPQNPKEVKLLALGMSRTGTMSLKAALIKLGYTPYHASEAVKGWDKGHLHLWDEALRAKYKGEGKPWGKEEFNKMLADYDVVTDIPCIAFVDELIAAYPHAKVMLTNRDVETWISSMNKSFYTVLGWRTLPTLAAWDTALFQPYFSLLHIILNNWTQGNWQDRGALRQGFKDHYEHVRAIVPKENLLEFRSQDGWGPLCEFLGKEVPEGPYPRVNDGEEVVRLHKMVYWWRLVTVVVKNLGIVGMVGAPVVVGWWWLGRK
ncbi:NAD dependent epimerase/dehydratase [Tricladium varicosporioides]|nr:NAD dependent epimerase/dehydratase [Hymenoscyphus varicosporioides]